MAIIKCPACGLTNPPEAIRCDCGFNFKNGSPSHHHTNEVKIKDFDMPFGSMIVFMVKWAIAAIPAMIILAVIWTLGAALLSGVLSGVLSGLTDK